mmetsp:Transcript_24507/g.58361  ORF Transcript_24507/g.58361 Transcript_24507/m.58361 type:complete len:346 (+) Transcript_24507:38-1075(+)
MAGVEFRAGKMKLNGGQLRPDNRKGVVRLAVSPEDQLLHLTWTSRENGVVEDDRMIFPGDATFSYVEQARGNAKNPRVYVLKFSDSTERLFFWMQEPSDAKDEENCKAVNAKISGEEPAAGGGEGGANMGQLDQAQLLSMLTRGAQQTPDASSSAPPPQDAAPASSAAPPAPAAAPSSASAMEVEPQQPPAAPPPPPQGAAGAGAAAGLNTANLASILANLGQGGGAGGAAKQTGPSLDEVMDPRAVLAALEQSPQLQASLLETLPEGDRSPQGLREALMSPQLAQAVHQVDRLLQSGQAAPIFLSLQLPLPPTNSSYGPAAVRSLITGLEKQQEDKDKAEGKKE